MLLAEATSVLMTFILYISGVQGPANSICALKGSSVDLPCSAQHHTSAIKWYTAHWDGNKYVRNEISADGNRVTYNVSAESNFTLSIKDLTKRDANLYCCGNVTDNPELCWHNKTELQVADLQVKVIPATEGQTVTLICSSSCPLTENPEVYIWYKNGEFLYQDWSPWYQELVSGEKAVRYSCAIKGYEDHRAPQVSVDWVTPTCFNVTYAKGRMCSYQQTSEDEPCYITYPTEVHFQETHGKQSVILTCNTSCPLADHQTAFRWYWNGHLKDQCESQHVTVFNASDESLSCAVKGHEDLHSDEVCLRNSNCWRSHYVSRRLCALEGSSVNISSVYSYPSSSHHIKHLWNKVQRHDEEEEEDAEALTEDAGRVEFHDNMKNYHILRISNLKKNDSAEYTFTLQRDDECQHTALPGVTLVVTGLTVKFSPSAVVTEYQRVTLTCSTSCPLTKNTNYIWFFNSRPLTLTANQNKHLVLDAVSSQHAGNYSCAVKNQNHTSSPEKTLTVQALKLLMIVNAIKLIVLLLIVPAIFLLYPRMTQKKTAAELSNKVQAGQMDQLCESIALTTRNPGAWEDPTEQQEGTV